MEFLAARPLSEAEHTPRSELLSPEKLAGRAQMLAESHRVARRRGSIAF